MAGRRKYASYQDLIEVKDDIKDIKENHLPHLNEVIMKLGLKVAFNTKLLWVIMGGLITAYLIERIFR